MIYLFIYFFQIQYNPHSPLVLHGITCTFHGGKRIGVVGRTGSGKSTLIQAMFRIVEPTRGRIIVDGLDVTTIGLHDLRSWLSIIPQDPTLFEGTMRSNLDPHHEHTDIEVWEVNDFIFFTWNFGSWNFLGIIITLILMCFFNNFYMKFFGQLLLH